MNLPAPIKTVAWLAVTGLLVILATSLIGKAAKKSGV